VAAGWDQTIGEASQKRIHSKIDICLTSIQGAYFVPYSNAGELIAQVLIGQWFTTGAEM
jgi:hypothetical protein